ncbi:CalY family protein [Jidongwangia harbinensis]|uniref:CalY family protein n=1 Tax=Jidongwangia harbinensis TaxID=2878561 RepID=UPI001CD91C46|nr:CalY family protein [Jidongwangia harbinensis]MCA2218383.1 CalY family protein [Jidongwangia harbinensis]
MCQRCEGKHQSGRRVGGWFAVVALGAVGAGLTGTGVFASWVSTSAMQTGDHSAAAMGLTHTDTNGTTFTSGVANMLPGDYLYRYANLVNTGTVTESFSAAVTGTGTLAGAGGLRLAVDACSLAWAGDGSCSGSTTPIVTVRDVATAGTVALGDIAAGATSHLRYRFVLDAGADQATFQGATGKINVAITGTTTAVGNRDRTSG